MNGFRMMFFLGALAVLPACGDEELTVCEEVETLGCPECYDGDTTCSYDGVTVTEPSCDGCQARASLLQELCDAGSDATVAEVDENMECETQEFLTL